MIARKLLDRGDPYAAYAIARNKVAKSVEKRIEADSTLVGSRSATSNTRRQRHVTSPMRQSSR